MTSTFPIVGAHFRPPAKAILQVLPAGAALRLIPEPDNAYDPNAIKVVLPSADAIPESELDNFGLMISGYGLTVDDVLAAKDIHLGYIPATMAATLQLPGPIDGKLGFNMQGKPTVTCELPEAPE